MGDLLGLAERFVRLNAELEETRAAMLASLMNGAGDPRPFSQVVRQKPGGSQPSQHPNAARSAEAEEKIVALLRERPMKAVEITAATESKQSTTSERLRRLRQRGLVTLGGGGAWAAAP